MFFINGVMRVILDAAPLQIEKFNLMNWSEDYISGNVLLIILLACCLLSVLFTIGGIALTIKKRNAQLFRFVPFPPSIIKGSYRGSLSIGFRRIDNPPAPRLVRGGKDVGRV